MNFFQKAFKKLHAETKDHESGTRTQEAAKDAAHDPPPAAETAAPSAPAETTPEASSKTAEPARHADPPPKPKDSGHRSFPPRAEVGENIPERQKTTLKDLVLSDEALAKHLDHLAEKESKISSDWLEALAKPLPRSTSIPATPESRPEITRTLRSGPVDPGVKKSLEISEPVSAWRSMWLSTLANRSPATAAENALKLPENAEFVTEKTMTLADTIFETLSSLSEEFNRYPSSARLRITTTKPAYVREVHRSEGNAAERESTTYYRGRASTALWSLSVRSKDGLVEFFLVPVGEVMGLSEAETATRLKSRMKLCGNEQGVWWTIDGLPVDSLELRATLRRLFKDLVVRSADDGDNPVAGLSLPSGFEGDSLVNAINELVLDKQNLVQKIVIQQEEIQNNIARDLHDAVISDVMMLKRSLSGDHKLTDEEVIEVLDKITRHLREICNDLAPRDLKDWGLQTVIDDMLQRIGERTGADCSFVCDSDLPELPHAVQLHIYRIAQECLNNVEKYAEASKVLVSLDHADGALRLTVQDNGKGFSVDNTAQKRGMEGGKGMGGIRERAELIRCFYPTNVWVESEPNKGTTTKLEISLSGTFA